MNSEQDRRLIEDYLPIEAISKEASREKRHISGLHLWWARRPLVACRAAVYGTLVPASRFLPKNGPEDKRASLGRANAAKFVDRLCKYPGDPSAIAEAQRHIFEAHAERLTEELAQSKSRGEHPAWADEFKSTGDLVTVDDINGGRAPRPRVLDMFAGGGAIPLEALRLGCEAYAMDLNPVAYIIELCTLVYPQKYGKPGPDAGGMTGSKNSKGETTWGGLAKEVRHWGEWVLKKVKGEIGDLYPLIPDPGFKGNRKEIQTDWLRAHDSGEIPHGYLMPVAYLWTRTVRCKNPACGAMVPLVKQTWLGKKKDRYFAMKIIAPKGKNEVRFEVVDARSEKGLGFNPSDFSEGGNATCFFCGTVADNDYVKREGCAGHLGAQLMAVVCTRPDETGKTYLAPSDALKIVPDEPTILRRIETLCVEHGLTVPNEPIESRMTGGICLPYGLTDFGKLFTARQTICLLSFCVAIRAARELASIEYKNGELGTAIGSYLAAILDKVADYNSTCCAWHYNNEQITHTFNRQALPMVWDFTEVNVFGGASGSWKSMLQSTTDVLPICEETGNLPAAVARGLATALPWPGNLFDAVITDPPYYDNVDYAKLSDFFYVWLKRSIGYCYPEHFASPGVPKKTEIVADPVRHGGSKDEARRAYEEMMMRAFREVYRVLKTEGKLVVVYAHKTTLGWATLVDALRVAGFTVNEAWPLDTEMKTRMVARNTAALASSIFLVARKREQTKTGNYEEQVRLELEEIVCERVETLWDLGISGADLVIACVGAGLRAFTRFARVEYANGEEVPAERFLSEVETNVLETILGRLSKEVGSRGAYSLAGLDAATRFYVLWRYTYRSADLEAGEAIIFANGTHVELDGPGGLSTGGRALVEKKKGKYRLLDYIERGDDEKLGMTDDDGQPVPLVDALHRTLWLMENRPGQLAEFLQEAQPNREQMRLVAQALAGPALKGGELADVSPSGEMAALAKLTANWRSVVEDQMLPLFNR